MHRFAPTAALLAALALPTLALAGGKAHRHGVVALNLTLDGPLLSLSLQAPLDDLLGFERAPRTDAERATVAAALQRLDPGSALWQPNPEAGCTLGATRIDAPVLQQAQAGADAHADLEASYEFRCEQPQRLQRVGHALFKAFPRIQRIELQFALPGGQGRAQLRSPQATISLKR